jgi:glycogen debranching enzyme
MNLDLALVPFSRHGSYIAFSRLAGTDDRREGLYVRSVHRRGYPGVSVDRMRPIARVELVRDGAPVPFTEQASPTLLHLETDGGHVEICIPEPNVVRARGVGVGLRLAVDDPRWYENAIPAEGGRWRLSSWLAGTQFLLTPLDGTLEVAAPWSVDRSEFVAADFLPDPGTGRFECAIEEFITTWQARDHPEDFDACLEGVTGEHRAWLERTPAVPAPYEAARELAAYINWSCVVAPRGYLTRPAMLMSKNWMPSIWSWDNCFNAMALCYVDPALAWDQLMIFVDNQDATGLFPDSVSECYRDWAFCKPPVHGWALEWMMERTAFIDDERLAEIYEPLCRWTRWWFDARDDDHDGIPQYNHGNDSGWDNATVFAARPPTEAPDLAAYLILQMDALARVSRRLGKEQEASRWQSQAGDLLDRLLSHSWRGDRFVAPRSGDHEVFESDCLLPFVPIVLGERLPGHVRAALIEGLSQKDRFLTEHGLATESVSSPFYEPDGYWRGPIWAPSTMLFVDGLARAGATDLACDLAHRFCRMAARAGMAENYDAITGEGLRDRAYTWTASVFTILAHEYLDLDRPGRAERPPGD